MTKRNDAWLREAFGKEAELPSDLEAKLRKSYDTIRLMSRGKEERMIFMKNTEKCRKSIKTIAFAAAVVLILSMAVLAAGLHTDFFHSAYGTGVESRSARTEDKLDADGHVIGQESYPAAERVEPDMAAAEELMEGHVAHSGDRVSLGGYTFTMEDIVLDENGNGAVTVRVENPNGLNIKEDGIYYALQGEFIPFSISFRSAGRMLSSREHLSAESLTETSAVYVCYLAGGAWSEGADIQVAFRAWNGGFDEAMAGELGNGQVCPLYDEESLLVSAAPAAETVALAGESVLAEVSPVGMKLTWENYLSVSDEMYGQDGTAPVCREIVLCYADGSEYVVRSAEQALDNAPVSYTDKRNVWIAFNRLAEVEMLESVQLVAGGENKELTLLPE